MYVHPCVIVCDVRYVCVCPSSRPLTIEHNGGVAIDAAYHVAHLHPVGLAGVEVTVTATAGVPGTWQEKRHFISHTNN